MDISLEFFEMFISTIYTAAPLLAVFLIVIIVLGQIVGVLEHWKKSDTLYWSLITATTVGYGDIRPTKFITKMLSILIALIGLIFTGLLIALAIHVATYTFKYAPTDCGNCISQLI